MQTRCCGLQRGNYAEAQRRKFMQKWIWKIPDGAEKVSAKKKVNWELLLKELIPFVEHFHLLWLLLIFDLVQVWKKCVLGQQVKRGITLSPAADWGRFWKIGWAGKKEGSFDTLAAPPSPAFTNRSFFNLPTFGLIMLHSIKDFPQKRFTNHCHLQRWSFFSHKAEDFLAQNTLGVSILMVTLLEKNSSRPTGTGPNWSETVCNQLLWLWWLLLLCVLIRLNISPYHHLTETVRLSANTPLDC